MQRKLITTAIIIVLTATGAVALSASAAEPPLPQVTTVTYINGCFNVAVWYKESAYPSAAGANLTCTYEIEMKRPGETEWSDVTSSGSFSSFANFRGWTMPTNYLGSAEYRIRSKDTGTSETSQWVELGSVEATVNVKGKPIYGNGCNGNAFDGNIITIVDATTDSGQWKYIGYLFDEPTRIKKIRYLPRLNHNSLPDRYCNSIFQIASDEAFSDAETVHTVPSDFSNISGATEVIFEEPITARAIRHYKEGRGYESSAEVEFIPADMPLKPATPVCQWLDITNFQPVVTWTVPANVVCSTSRLERALYKDGPWVAQTDWLDPATDSLCVTNNDLHVGIPYYYRVAAVTDHPYFAGQTVYSSIATYTRMKRIDRSWNDEASLYSGITIMPGTNGATSVKSPNNHGNYEIKTAFDGNVTTFPDAWGAFRSGPVGLNFGESVWVGAFGYICRPDQSGNTRIKNTALYSSSGDDTELLDKVQRSEKVSQASQDATFYTQPATSVLDDGARCWFLWGDNFYCNVAELAFFGWTAADKASAPVVSPPAYITFDRGATGPVVSWPAGANAAAYTLKRRPRGETEWTEVVTVTSATLSHYDEDLASGFYEYCVVADGDEMGVATSDAFLYAWYAPGNGTGLAGAVMWPYCSTNMIPWQMTASASRGAEAVNINLGAADEIAPGVVAHARMVWEGSLIVPFAGNYTITLETDAGGAVAIDGVFACNSWTGGTSVPSGAINLSAGEHAIRVDYRLSDDDAPTKKCVLRWSGPVAEEVIPASQLIPAATPPSPMIDGWTCVSYHMAEVAQFSKTSDGTYQVTMSKQDMGGPTSFNTAFMWKRISGSFIIDAKVYGINGSGGIMLQGDNGHFVMPCFRSLYNGGNRFYGLRKFLPGDASWSQGVDWVGMSATACYLRVERHGQDIDCFWKLNAGDPWTKIDGFTAPAGMFGRGIAVGFAACGYDGSATNGSFQFSEINIKEIDGLVIIVK